MQPSSLLILLSFLITQLGCNSNDKSPPPSAVKNNDNIEQTVKDFKSGSIIFKRYCNSCYLKPLSANDDLMFINLFDRLPEPSEDYFFKFISNSKALKDSGDQHALAIDKVWNTSFEHMFRDSLSSADISNLVTYLKIEIGRNSY